MTRQRAYQLRRKAANGCHLCAAPAVPGMALCQHHRENLAAYHAKNRNPDARDYACTACGTPGHNRRTCETRNAARTPDGKSNGGGATACQPAAKRGASPATTVAFRQEPPALPMRTGLSRPATIRARAKTRRARAKTGTNTLRARERDSR